jgi:hypothetical protein
LNVAEAGDETPRETDEIAATERRAQGSTVAALNAFSAGVTSPARGELRLADPDDAIQALTAAVDQDTLQVPRLLVLDSLVRFADRRGDELMARSDGIDMLLEALVRKAGAPEAEVGDAVDTVHRALDSVAGLSGEASAADRWRVFVQQAAGPLQLTQAEIEKPTCNDRERVKKGEHEAIGVTVEFHTDASPGELRNFCDPTRWHECSAYQKEMTPWDHPGAIDEVGPGPNGWRRDLLETVELTPGKELETALRFSYGIEDEDDPGWVHLDYVLLETTNDILVDEGSLDVRRVTSGTQRGRTRVSAKKAILFQGLLAEWPTVACDTFWMDLVIDAAVGCLGPKAAIDSTEGKAKMAASKESPLDKAIEDATEAAHRSVAAYGKLANEAATQLAGDSAADTDKWVQLTTRTWAQAARDAAQAWITYTALLQALADSDGDEKKHPASGGTDTDDTKPEGSGSHS